MTRKPSVLVAIALLAGCGEKRPPVPTAEQSDQLNEAEDLLNSAANEEGPADRSTGPDSRTKPKPSRE